MGGKARVMLHISWTQGQDSSPDLEFFKRGNKRKILHEKVHQTDSSLGPYNHQFNALTTMLVTAAAQLTEKSLLFMDIYIYNSTLILP